MPSSLDGLQGRHSYRRTATRAPIFTLHDVDAVGGRISNERSLRTSLPVSLGSRQIRGRRLPTISIADSSVRSAVRLWL